MQTREKELQWSQRLLHNGIAVLLLTIVDSTWLNHLLTHSLFSSSCQEPSRAFDGKDADRGPTYPPSGASSNCDPREIQEQIGGGEITTTDSTAVTPIWNSGIRPTMFPQPGQGGQRTLHAIIQSHRVHEIHTCPLTGGGMGLDAGVEAGIALAYCSIFC